MLYQYSFYLSIFYSTINIGACVCVAIVYQIGELIGGSQREERLDLLEDRLDNLQLNKDSYWWYLDLRRYGSGKAPVCCFHRWARLLIVSASMVIFLIFVIACSHL